MTDLAAWLSAREQHYGGIHHAKRNVVSPHDPRTPEEIARGMMTGGDRMTRHGYAEMYAEELAPFVARDSAGERLTIVELGILRGVGLAVWCDLFPNAHVIGLDVDPTHYDGNVERLRSLGANVDEIEVYRFDELAVDVPQRLTEIFGTSRIDIMIDDALHYDDAITKAFADFLPFMADDFRYFIEDNRTAWMRIVAGSTLNVKHRNQLSVVSR